AERSDIVVTMVTSSPDVEAVTFGPDGIASGARPELLAIAMSTISPAASRDSAKRAAANKSPFHTLDAAVSGGALGAIEARLAIGFHGRSATEGSAARPRQRLRRPRFAAGDRARARAVYRAPAGRRRARGQSRASEGHRTARRCRSATRSLTAR